jgi:hypothetical protein
MVRRKQNVILAALTLCGTCHAFTVNGAKLPDTVHYRCDAKLRDCFLAQFAQWNNVLADRFSLVEETSPDATVDVSVQYSSDVMPMLGWCSNGAIAIATTMPTGEDLSTVMLHELGHRLGLGHTPVESATMFRVIYTYKGPVLTQDDIDGVRSIYGLPAFVLDSFQLSVTGTGKSRVFFTSGYTVHWNFGDGLDATGQKVKHRFAANGTYVITATYLGVNRSVSIIIGHLKRVHK